MERAGRLIGKLKIPKGVWEPDDLARTAWPSAVGRRIAAHTRAIRLVRGQLIVECEDNVWQQHLHTLSRHVLDNLRTMLGPGVVYGLDFRPRMTPRFGPQTAQSVTRIPKPSTDEADEIGDPVFRHLYKQSRRKQLGFDFTEPEPLKSKKASA
jgi:hypothetical protein